jgi:hypothetical protein
LVQSRPGTHTLDHRQFVVVATGGGDYQITSLIPHKIT